jgi:cytidine deaminase
MTDRKELVALARKVAQRAYCPYSNNRVGSALLANGKIYVGVNVEISSYGHTICAERSAIVAAISDGSKSITEIAVACIDVPEGASINKRCPCRTCRQWLADLAPNAVVYIDGTSDEFCVSSEEWLKSCSRNAFQIEENPQIKENSYRLSLLTK